MQEKLWTFGFLQRANHLANHLPNPLANHIANIYLTLMYLEIWDSYQLVNWKLNCISFVPLRLENRNDLANKLNKNFIYRSYIRLKSDLVVK